jgi:hypothetical protein
MSEWEYTRITYVDFHLLRFRCGDTFVRKVIAQMLDVSPTDAVGLMARARGTDEVEAAAASSALGGHL